MRRRAAAHKAKPVRERLITVRTFLAVEVPRPQREAIFSLIQSLRAESLPVKWVNLENLHITLKFLGEADERRIDAIQPVLKDIARHQQPFLVRLAGIGGFPNRHRPRVLWVGVENGAAEITKLAITLDQELYRYDFLREEKKFHPHLTFGRAQIPLRPRGQFDQEFATEPFTVQNFTLYKSTLRPEGPLYEMLVRFPFG